jgi:hypothetical protein
MRRLCELHHSVIRDRAIWSAEGCADASEMIALRFDQFILMRRWFDATYLTTTA